MYRQFVDQVTDNEVLHDRVVKCEAKPLMTNNVKTSKMAVEDIVGSTGKEFTAKNYDAFRSKPRAPLLNKSYSKQSPHEIGSKTLTTQESTLLKDKLKITDCEPRKREKRNINNKETSFSAKPTGLSSNTKKLGKIRTRYTKQCDTTETPGKLSIAICAPKTNVEEMRSDSWKIPIDRPERESELVNGSTVLNKKATDKSSVKPIAPVDATKNEQAITAVPGSSLEITSTVTDVKIEQSASTPNKSKNLRKKIAKRLSSIADVSSVECIDEINVSRENETIYSAKPKGSTTQNSGKNRIKYTKLYEITEIPGKPSVQTCTPKSKRNVEEMHINHVRKPAVVSIDFAIGTKVLDKKAVEESTVKLLAPVDKPKKEPVLPITVLGELLEKTTVVTEVKTQQCKSTVKTSKNYRKKMSRLAKYNEEQYGCSTCP